MVKIYPLNDLLLLSYSPVNGVEWLYRNLSDDGNVIIKKTFSFGKKDLYLDNLLTDEVTSMSEDASVTFVLGTLCGDYYRVKGDKLGIEIDIYFGTDVKITPKMFTAYSNICVFSQIARVVKEDIYIGNNEGDLPIEEFDRLIKFFPNSTERQKYSLARISKIVRDYFDDSIAAESDYERYLNRKHQKYGATTDSIVGQFARQEYEKYSAILAKLNKMLDSEKGYPEKIWQHEILEILLLLYPKYIRVFSEVMIYDVYNKTRRRLDYMLIDSSGNIDIAEIKRPGNQNIVSKGKYRDSFVPLRELSGAVMQVEKYIFLLSKWGKRGEEELTARYKSELPCGFKINIINPGGLVIMGRDKNLNPGQRMDLEVIKRKYKNVVDIITYDDLIERLKNTLFKFESQI